MTVKMTFRETSRGWSVSVYVDGELCYTSEVWPDKETAQRKAERFVKDLRGYTTGYKCMFGTPNLDTSEGRDDVQRLRNFTMLEEALFDLIVSEGGKNE